MISGLTSAHLNALEWQHNHAHPSHAFAKRVSTDPSTVTHNSLDTARWADMRKEMRKKRALEHLADQTHRVRSLTSRGSAPARSPTPMHQLTQPVGSSPLLTPSDCRTDHVGSRDGCLLHGHQQPQLIKQGPLRHRLLLLLLQLFLSFSAVASFSSLSAAASSTW